jgi:2-amino-4-hydroxy-6-hydroxymethyldihydropteridine diphosphokinase
MNRHSLSKPAFSPVKPLIVCPQKVSALSKAFVAIGSNLGERERNLEGGLRALRAKGVVPRRRSALYLTAPVGGPPQGWYLNAVAEVETALSPEGVLAACLEAEGEHGRVRTVKDAPRTLDLDLLLFGDLVRPPGSLELPHPRMHLRRFVLVPLCEIAPGVVHPTLGLSVRELLARCPDTSEVQLFVPELAR